MFVKRHLFKVFLGILLLIGCSEKPSKKNLFIVKNDLNMHRSFETIEIDLDILNDNKKEDKSYRIINTSTNEEITSQALDSNKNGIIDKVLFQPIMKPNSETTFEILSSNGASLKKNDEICFSRFVPERTDDYAWENNRVAFRTYGPTAQKMIEENIDGGTLSSGIDAWLKRVDYPIINKWYAKTISGKGTYHEDTGEGLDNFHVGASRGIGGISVKVDTSYYYSKNFTSWETITNGPIRTSFVLHYNDWDANGNIIAETKHISLDYGSNLSKYTIQLKGTNTVSAGLTLHKKDGEISMNKNQRWISYWEFLEDSELGQGIVIPKGFLIDFQDYRTNKIDESNLYANLKVTDNKVTYYAGFGWKKSNQFKTKKEWNDYLADFSIKLDSPLIVKKI